MCAEETRVFKCDFDSNSVVGAIREHIRKKSAPGDELIERMMKVS